MEVNAVAYTQTTLLVLRLYPVQNFVILWWNLIIQQKTWECDKNVFATLYHVKTWPRNQITNQ